MTYNEKLIFLIKYLLAENPKYADIPIPMDINEKFILFRSLVNIRPPKQADNDFLTVQDRFLQEGISEKGITDIADLQPIEDTIYLWRGDITTLKCGAMVNAAQRNDRMLSAL